MILRYVLRNGMFGRADALVRHLLNHLLGAYGARESSISLNKQNESCLRFLFSTGTLVLPLLTGLAFPSLSTRVQEDGPSMNGSARGHHP